MRLFFNEEVPVWLLSPINDKHGILTWIPFVFLLHQLSWITGAFWNDAA